MKLSNNLEMLHRPSSREISSFSVMVAFGSKHDTVPGLAHFLEHMLFKGNKSKSAKRLCEELENLGGYVNAFTTREETCLQMQVLNSQVPQALALLSEMLFQSDFPEAELEVERKVILQELKASLDNPEEQVEDLLFKNLWPNSSFGQPIGGTITSVRKIQREHLLKQHEQFYQSGHLMIACSSGLKADKLQKEIEKHFLRSGKSKSNPIEATSKIKPFKAWTLKSYNHRHELSQAYVCSAFAMSGQNALNPLARIPFQAISYLLTDGLNSRLFQELREKRGLVYHLSSQLESYRDGTFFGLNFSVAKSKLAQTMNLVKAQLENLLGEAKFDSAELERAKKYLLTQEEIFLQSELNITERDAAQQLSYGRIYESSEVCQAIHELNLKSLQAYAENLFASDFGPLLVNLA